MILYVETEIQLKNSWVIKSKNKNVLFIGDSHIEVSIDDNNNHFYTLAQSGDCYLYTYCKLKRFLLENPSFDTICLGIDYHNIDKTSEEWYTSQSYLNYKFPACYPFLSKDDIKILFSLHPKGFIKSIPYIFSISENKSSLEYMKSFGYYNPIDSTMDLNELNKSFKSNYVNYSSEVQFMYLEKIRELCQEKGKVLILITTPIHKSVFKNSILDSKLEEYVTKKNILYLNYRNYNLSDDCFLDKFHLNRKGSQIFTNKLLIYGLTNNTKTN